MSEMGDDFRQIREEQQKKKNERRKSSLELILLHEGDFDYTTKMHSEFHISLFRSDGSRLDVWPSSGKAMWFEKNKRPSKSFKIGNIEEYIFAHFKLVK
jgi:hypothetical protein